jgi:ACR3 family arsenite efflux pump ArsB
MLREIVFTMYNFKENYIVRNKLLFLFAFYFLLSTLLKAITDIDVCIPCLWKSIFGITCPGCGLTTAFINLIKLDFKNALESNVLIFLILPLGLYYLIQDYIIFKRKSRLEANK